MGIDAVVAHAASVDEVGCGRDDADDATGPDGRAVSLQGKRGFFRGRFEKKRYK